MQTHKTSSLSEPLLQCRLARVGKDLIRIAEEDDGREVSQLLFREEIFVLRERRIVE